MGNTGTISDTTIPDYEFKIKPLDLENLISYYGGTFYFDTDGISFEGDQFDGMSETENESWQYEFFKDGNLTLSMYPEKDGYIPMKESDEWDYWEAVEGNAKLRLYPILDDQRKPKEEEFIREMFEYSGLIRFKATLQGIDCLLRAGDRDRVKINSRGDFPIIESKIVNDALIWITEDKKEIEIRISNCDGMANVYITESDMIVCDTGDIMIAMPVITHDQFYHHEVKSQDSNVGAEL